MKITLLEVPGMSLGVKYCLKKIHGLLKGFYSCRRSWLRKAKQNTHRRRTSLNCPPKSLEKCGVWSFLKEIWLLYDRLCGIFCFQTVFWCPHGNGSNFLFPRPSKTFLGTSDSVRPSLSFALERYKYPGPVPGTFKQGLGFIFYLVTFRETYPGDQAGRGVHLAKAVSQEEN